jgi:hypothetical protein
VTGLWFSQGTPVSSTNKTDRHDLTEILLKVALNTITLTENTNIEELQVLFHALSDRELRNKASLMIRVFPIRELKPGGLCYLSTCAKLYLEIGLNYSIICNLDR